MRASFHRLAAVVLAVCLTSPVSLFAYFRADKRTEPLVDQAAALNQAYIDAMNRERVARGIAPLRANRVLALAAQDRVRDMFAKHYFAHVAPDGTKPFSWLEVEGYDYREAGENLAVGYAGAAAVVDGWMHSPGHRANILNAAFTEVGVAFAPRSPARPFEGPLVVAIYGGR